MEIVINLVWVLILLAIVVGLARSWWMVYKRK
jgi:hypothetical protein